MRKIQEGEVPRGRPEGVGKPEKPEGAGKQRKTDRPSDSGFPTVDSERRDSPWI